MAKITIGDMARERLVQAQGNRAEYAAILAEIREAFPGANTTASCLDWYCTELRKRGLLPDAAPRGPKLTEAERKANKKARDAAWRKARDAKFAAEKAARLEAAAE